MTQFGPIIVFLPIQTFFPIKQPGEILMLLSSVEELMSASELSLSAELYCLKWWVSFANAIYGFDSTKAVVGQWFERSALSITGEAFD